MIQHRSNEPLSEEWNDSSESPRSERGSTSPAAEPPRVEVDLYGIRILVTPSPDDRGDPESWREVWLRVHRHFRGIITNTVALINDTLISARSLVRGVGGLPEAVRQRVTRARTYADEAEAERIHAIAAPDPALLKETLEALMARKRAEGYTVRLDNHDGKIVLCFLRATDDKTALAISTAAAEMLPSVTPSPQLPSAESDET